MTETSRPWGGTVLGDAASAPYDDSEFSAMLRELTTADRTIESVVNTNLTNYSGLLQVTNPSGTVVRVASGVAIVDGKMYYNNANIDFNASTVGGYYRAILRKDFVAQTVRAALLGPSGSEPALTQTDGVVWEVPLAYVLNSGGSLIIVDERTYVNRVLHGMYEYLSADVGDYALDSIDASNIRLGIAKLEKRQGAPSVASWSSPGTYNYDTSHVTEQVGATSITMNLAGSTVVGSTPVVFAVPFDDIPLVMLTLGVPISGLSYPQPPLMVSAVSTTGFTVYSRDDNITPPATFGVYWRAVGRK